jgi:hypothetical protein
MAKKKTPPNAQARVIPEPDSPEVAALKEPADRVAYIADLMRRLRFERGYTSKVLAKAWGIQPASARRYSAEASRVVRAEVTNRDDIEQDVGSTLMWAMKSAVQNGDRRNAISAAKVAAEVSGVKAAERHEVVTTEATPENARRLMEGAFGKLTPTTEPDSEASSDGAAPAE